MNRIQDSSDENYWFSGQRGFNFDGEEGFVIVDSPKSKVLEDIGSVRHQGFDEIAEQKAYSPDDDNARSTITDMPSVVQKQTQKSTDTCSSIETAKNLFNGQPYFFEQFKSYSKKVDLLDSTIKLHDGNGIMATLLYLEKTLKPSLFHQILMDRPVAINHYLNYLKMLQKNVELTDILVMLQKTEEAAIVQYKSAISTQQTEQKIKNLKKCWKNHLAGDQNLLLYSNLIQEYINLLERQLPIEEEDTKQEKEMKNPVFQNLPRTASLLNMPLITTLYYCCLYHYNLPANHLASPRGIQEYHKLTNKQFVWTALAALTKRQMWMEIENLFQNKSWLGKTKLNCCIGFDKAVELLHNLQAPMEIIVKYLKLVENTEVRLELAKKYKCEQLAVDTLISMNDRQGLIKYKDKLTPHSKACVYLEDALKSSTIKWKN